jgi:DNA-binding GntR family transcriptional regulator
MSTPGRSQARTPSLTEEAARLLREEILGGELAPGARVHLIDASRRLGMSIVPIREALRSLHSEGLVVALPQRGYRVSELNLADFDDTYRLRLVLDPMAVELAVPLLDDPRREVLGAAFTGLERAYRKHDRAAHAIEHRRFHFAIYEACGSPWLLRCLGVLWENSVRYQRISGQGGRRGLIEDRIEEHRRIRDACAGGDAAGAATQMRDHLAQTVRAVHAAIEQTQAGG